ncbi:MAG: ATP-binding cassette domain-containing protein, partial [Phaeobacter italicus]
ISHKIGEVMALADEVTVIRQGETVFHAAISETSGDEISGHIVQGGTAPEQPTGQRGALGQTVLNVSGLSTPSVQKSQHLSAITLDIRAGEILGLAGVSGNGQVELVECLAGLRPIESGSVRLNGTEVTGATILDRRKAGLAYVSADRRHEGLTPEASIQTNVIAGSHRSEPIARRGILNRFAMRRVAQDRLTHLKVKFGTLADPVSSLSGGNQQKLVFAREIAANPKLLVASQPTRGVDLGGIAAIHTLIRAFASSGGAVLLASEELDELVSLSTRVIVISDGTLVGEVDTPAQHIQEIGHLMVQGRAA